VKKGIHPEYGEAKVKRDRGNELTTRSTLAKINMEICSAPHPFQIGTQRYGDTAGGIEKSGRKYGKNYGIKEKQSES
jgi:large subunit ribosomal protein L31